MTLIWQWCFSHSFPKHRQDRRQRVDNWRRRMLCSGLTSSRRYLRPVQLVLLGTKAVRDCSQHAHSALQMTARGATETAMFPREPSKKSILLMTLARRQSHWKGQHMEATGNLSGRTSLFGKNRRNAQCSMHILSELWSNDMHDQAINIRKFMGSVNGTLNIFSNQLEFLHASQQETRDKILHQNVGRAPAFAGGAVQTTKGFQPYF